MEGARVRTARAEAGLTLLKLAEKSGVTRDTISKIERGVHVPQAGTLAKLAKALDRPVGFFIEESESPKDEAPLSLEWAVAALPEEFAHTIQESHAEVLKNLYQELSRQSWSNRDEHGFPDLNPMYGDRLDKIRKELRRRDPPAFAITTTRDTIEIRWLVPQEKREPYKELLSERLQEILSA